MKQIEAIVLSRILRNHPANLFTPAGWSYHQTGLFPRHLLRRGEPSLADQVPPFAKHCVHSGLVKCVKDATGRVVYPLPDDLPHPLGLMSRQHGMTPRSAFLHAVNLQRLRCQHIHDPQR